MADHGDLEVESNNEAKEFFLILEEFKHYEKVTNIIDSLKSTYNDDLTGLERTEENLKFIFDLYQEQPHLMDPYLERMLNQCISLIRLEDSSVKYKHCLFRVIYLMVKTRGYKSIVRLLPHEVADLEPTIKLINEQNPTDTDTWQTRYVLLLWLSIVSMIPFDLTRLDLPGREPIMKRIVNIGKAYLKTTDSAHSAAAYLLAKFLSRPDTCSSMLPEIIDWTCSEIKSTELESSIGRIYMAGQLRFLANVFKYGKREDLLPHAAKLLAIHRDIDLSDSRDIQIKKMRTKLVQRIGLLYLKMRVASWRYSRGNRSLAQNLAPQHPGGEQPHKLIANGDPGEEDLEEEDIPEEIAEVVDILITSLKDRDTVVRWSAAKGIGRICARLNKDLADDVVEAVVVLFSRLEAYSAWHGGCLALAELGRRGLLLPERLPIVVPLVVQSLFYDEKSGECSYGANVRDAACYVCWSFARAYEPAEMSDFVVDIASSLVLLTLFDREVNVRRAASAAFQENVGRQGQFPHGIDILTTCDYFAVGNRNACYLELSVFIAQYAQYIFPMVDHLSDIKLRHWDSSIREYAAKALFNLTPFAKEFIIANVLPRILPCCTGSDLYLRHGAILAVGELIHGIDNLNVLTDTMLDQIKEIVVKLKESQLFRGMSGELMRKAVCSLIEKGSLAKLPFHGDPVVDVWQEVLIECLLYKETNVQNSAVSAFPAFISTFVHKKDGTLDSIRQKIVLSSLIGYLTTSNENVQMGALRALGSAPTFFHEGQVDYTLSHLIKCTKITPKTERWGDARRDAVRSIFEVISHLGINHKELTDSILHNVFITIIDCLNDYTIDSRGDIGVIVREASMQSLADLCFLTVDGEREKTLSQDITSKIFSRVIQQASEKIDRTRAVAGGVLTSLLYHEPAIPLIPHVDRLKSVFNPQVCEEVNWASPQQTFRLFTQLLDLDGYRYNLILGLIVSVGGLTESTVRHSSESLRSCLQEHDSDVEYLNQFVNCIIDIFQSYQGVDRIIHPLLKFLDFLFHDSVLISHLENDDNSLKNIMELTRLEIIKSKDVHKIKGAIDTYCGLLQFSEEIRKKSLFFLMVLLGHPYPIIRKNTASKFYEALLMSDVVPEEKLDDVINILTESIWENSLAEIRPIRNQLCDILGVDKPVLKKST